MADAKNHTDFAREIANRIKMRMHKVDSTDTGVVVELDFPNNEWVRGWLANAVF